MENCNKKAAIAALGLVAALLGTSAQAVIPLSGNNVTYSFDSPLGLFGTASIVAGNLVLTPTQFEASTSGVNGILPTAFQTLNITVTANPGYQLSGFNLTESGGYSLTGGAAAFVTGTFTATNIEGTSLPAAVDTFSNPLSIGSSTWQANAGVAPDTGWGTNGVVHYVSLTLSNQLMTVANGGTADVWKNLVTINTVTSPVPEANTYAMMLVGLGLVGFMVRRARTSV